MNLYKILWWSLYDRYFAPSYFNSVYGQFSDYLISHKVISSDMTVCDIWCGSGNMLNKLCSMWVKQKNCIGIDPSDKMIDSAKKKLSEATFITSVSDKYSLDSKFDLVYSTIAFHHFQNPQLSLQKMIDLVKPWWNLIIVDVSFRKASRYTEFINVLHHIDGWVRCYSIDERYLMLAKAWIDKKNIHHSSLKTPFTPVKLYHVKL